MSTRLGPHLVKIRMAVFSQRKPRNFPRHRISLAFHRRRRLALERRSPPAFQRRDVPAVQTISLQRVVSLHDLSRGPVLYLLRPGGTGPSFLQLQGSQWNLIDRSCQTNRIQYLNGGTLRNGQSIWPSSAHQRTHKPSMRLLQNKRQNNRAQCSP